MKTAAETIAYARALAASGQWWYQLGNHGRAIPAGLPGAGKLGADCQYLVDLAAIFAGFAGQLGEVLPWSVPYMIDHSTLLHAFPADGFQAGDVVVFGTAHTALATDAGHVIQAYNPDRGLIETTVAGVGLAPTLVLRPAYAQPTPPPPPGPLTVAVLPGDAAVRLIGSNGALVVPTGHDRRTYVLGRAVTVPGYSVTGEATSPAHEVTQDGGTFWLLDRNFTPANVK